MKERQEQRATTTPKLKGNCVVCGTELVENRYTTFEANPDAPGFMHRIIGPGGSNQPPDYIEVECVDGYKCPKCGLKYAHLPEIAPRVEGPAM